MNQPQIHTWLEAIGDPNPVYRETAEAAEIHGGPVAPPAMAQVWTMYGLDPHRPADDPLHLMMKVMDEAGFTSVLGTNCDQTYDRYLRPGEQVSVTTRLESVVGPKKTGVGEGYFVTTQERLAGGRRAGRHDDVPGAEVQAGTTPARARTGPARSARCATGTPSSSGRAPRPASSGSRPATPAAPFGTRRDRCAPRATRPTAATSCRPAADGSTPTSPTTRRRSRARAATAARASSSSTRACAWSERSGTPTESPGAGAVEVGHPGAGRLRPRSTTTSRCRCGTCRRQEGGDA